jgi:dihydrofolate reductase
MNWLQPDDEEQWDDLFTMLKEVDLFLLGRGMWAGYRDYLKKVLTAPGFSTNEVQYAQLAEKTPHIVFSHTLQDPEWENTSIAKGSVVEEISKLKQQSGKNIQLVGGATLAATVIEAGLVDEYRLLVNPVILSKGKSFFQQLHHPHPLTLTQVKKLSNGVVILTYKPSTPQAD